MWHRSPLVAPRKSTIMVRYFDDLDVTGRVQSGMVSLAFMKLLLCAVALLAVLGGLFLVFRPQPSLNSGPLATGTAATTKNGASDTSPTPSAEISTTTRHESRVFDLVVSGGRLVSGPTVIQVQEGDNVTLHVTADASDEVHVHGYDLRAKLHPGEMVTFQFVARRTGRYTIELHHASEEIGALEVYPR